MRSQRSNPDGSRTLPQRRSRASAAFTLLECLIAIVVVGIIAGVLAPVMHTVGSSVAAQREMAQSLDAASYAMERSVRLLRTIPEGATPGTLGVTLPSSGTVQLSNGRGLRFDGATSTLHETVALGGAPQERTLARGVTLFSVVPYDATGAAVVPAASAQRLLVTLRVGRAELRSWVLPRARMVSP